MICRNCGWKDRDDVYFCRDCGRAFYQIGTERDHLYFVDGETTLLRLRVENSGSRMLTLNEIAAGDTPLRPPPGFDMSVVPGASKTFDLRLPRVLSATVIPVVVSGTIHVKGDFNSSLQVALWPTPRLVLEPLVDSAAPPPAPGDDGVLILSRSRGTVARCRLSLRNDSMLTITRLSMSCGELITGLPIVLRRDQAAVIDVRLPMSGPGTRLTIEFVIAGEGLQSPLTSSLDAVFYASYESIELTAEDWTDEGLNPRAATDTNILLPSPASELRRRHFQIASMPPASEAPADPIILRRIDSDLPLSVSGLTFPTHILSGELPFVIDYESSETETRGGTLTFVSADASSPSGSTEHAITITRHTYQRQPYPLHVGVDFGTANSCVALSLPGRNPLTDRETIQRNNPLSVITLPLDVMESDTPDVIPSVLSRRGAAWYSSIGVPADSDDAMPYRDAKRKLLFAPDPATPTSSPQRVAEEIIAELLRRTINFLEYRRSALTDITKVCLAVPTTFLPAELQKLRQAARAALSSVSHRSNIDEFDVQEVDESLAAVRYLLETASPADRLRHDSADFLLVYDFGGGTTDVTAVARTEREGRIVYETVVAGGDSRLGGIDVDRFVEEVLHDLGIDEPTVPGRLVKLNMAKDQLLERIAPRAVSRRAELIAGVQERLRKPVSAIIQDVLGELATVADNGPARVGVILAGGSSRLIGFPKLLETVIRASITDNRWDFQLEATERLGDPKRAVAKGAFLYSAWGQSDYVRRNVTPYRVLWPIDVDVAATSIKLKVRRCRFRNGLEANFAEIIQRGAPLPAHVTISAADLGLRRRVDLPTLYFQLGSGDIDPLEVWNFDVPIEPASSFTVSLSADKQLDLRRI